MIEKIEGLQLQGIYFAFKVLNTQIISLTSFMKLTTNSEWLWGTWPFLMSIIHACHIYLVNFPLHYAEGSVRVSFEKNSIICQNNSKISASEKIVTCDFN